MRKLIRLLLAVVLVSGLAVFVLLSASLYTYSRLTAETVIAAVRFESVGANDYIAFLTTGDGCREQRLAIRGDQWRVDAEFVKWHYWANLLGLDAHYRLDRFEGRFSDTRLQNEASGRAYELTEPTALDLHRLANALGRWNFLVDATYGSSTYQKIDTQLSYDVIRSQTGIFTRSRPLSPPQPQASLAVEIRRACPDSQSGWQRASAWFDDVAVRLFSRRRQTPVQPG